VAAVPVCVPSVRQRIRSFKKAWASACERAGVRSSQFHDLRRSTVRNMERAGIPRSVAMKISGHKTEAVYRRYDIVSERDLREAAQKMERFMAEKVTPTVTFENPEPNQGEGKTVRKPLN